MNLINAHKSDYLPEIFSTQELNSLFEFLLKRMEKTNGGEYRQWARFRDYTLVRVLYDLALRPSEALKLKVSDLDFSRMRVTIRQENNKERIGRVVTISNNCAEILKLYAGDSRTKERIREDFLFPTSHQPFMNKHTWKWIFHDILMQCRLYRSPIRGTNGGHFSSYTLRHTRLTHLYYTTKDLMLTANFAGHTTLSSTMVYIHLASIANGYYDYMRQAQEKMNSVLIKNDLDLEPINMDMKGGVKI